MPPSVHPTGRRYCWSVDSASTFAAAPEWLLAMVAAAPPQCLLQNGGVSVKNEVEEGQRNVAAARLAGHLLRHSIDAHVVHELLQSWNAMHCRPPLSEAEVSRIIDSIAARELRRRGAP